MTMEELAKWHDEEAEKWEGCPERISHHTTAATTIRAAIEALRLADAALRGANMDMSVVERKVRGVLGLTPPKPRCKATTA